MPESRPARHALSVRLDFFFRSDYIHTMIKKRGNKTKWPGENVVKGSFKAPESFHQRVSSEVSRLRGLGIKTNRSELIRILVEAAIDDSPERFFQQEVINR